MKNSLLFMLAFLLFTLNASAQSDIKMRDEYGSENIDLMSVLYFEDTDLNKMTFAGTDLKGKDFQITLKEFVKGDLTKTDIVFDSKEDAYFKIKSEKFTFRVLTKLTSENTVKLQFQFNGFSKQKEYKVDSDHKNFALKSFLGSKPEMSIPLNADTYILTYMMPYEKKTDQGLIVKLLSRILILKNSERNTLFQFII